MDHLNLNMGSICTLICFSLSAISLWIPKNVGKLPLWLYLWLTSIVVGLFFGYLKPMGLIFLACGAAATVFIKNKPPSTTRTVTAGCLLLLFIALSLHVTGGFQNPKLIDGLILTEQAIPYNAYLNFDKTLMGIFIFGMLFPRVTSVSQLNLVKVWPIFAVLLVSIMPLAMLLGYVHFEPKLPSILPMWMIMNLLFTCLAEELLFRGLIQKSLVKWKGPVVGILAAAILFGIGHYRGGLAYVFLATFAGLSYGLAYHRSGERLEATILLHFGLNLTHLLLFTYPALATS